MGSNWNRRLRSIMDRGCGVFVVLLITLPVWVIGVGLRGPVFAIGALAFLLLAVFAFGWLNKRLGGG